MLQKPYSWLYAGDIRSIMVAIRDILGQSSERLATTVGREEAQALLARERWDRIKNAVGLTAAQVEIVRYFAEHPETLSQKDIPRPLESPNRTCPDTTSKL